MTCLRHHVIFVTAIGVGMAGLAELAAVMMSGAQQRIDVTAGNIGNVNTPGFRSRRVFAQLLDVRAGLPVATVRKANGVISETSVKQTGNPLDLATDPSALLVLRDAEGLHSTRSAQFHRDQDGHLVDTQGRYLQAAEGGDIVIGAGAPNITRTGVVFIDGQPQARIGLYKETAAGAMEPNDTGQIMQGRLIASDVDMAAEMTDLTKASRYAESGAKVFQIYDDLLGRASSMLGSLGR